MCVSLFLRNPTARTELNRDHERVNLTQRDQDATFLVFSCLWLPNTDSRLSTVQHCTCSASSWKSFTEFLSTFVVTSSFVNEDVLHSNFTEAKQHTGASTSLFFTAEHLKQIRDWILQTLSVSVRYLFISGEASVLREAQRLHYPLWFWSCGKKRSCLQLQSEHEASVLH